MTTLARKPHKPSPEHPLMDGLSLPYNRTHEICGPSRKTLTLHLLSISDAPIIWIKPDWHTDNLNPQGVARFINPGRITFARPRRLEDVLWCMEESLRAGCIPFVIAECETPPPLTPIRRLHLAAQSGAERSGFNILSLILTPGDGGAQGVENRWHVTPHHTPDRNRWLLQRRRARMSPPAAWLVERVENQFRQVPQAQQTASPPQQPTT